MTKKQKRQLEKFKGEFTRWMYGDAELALYLAQAQFLVALGLFNYIETLGAFHLGFFEKERTGKIKHCQHQGKKGSCSKCIGRKLKTTSTARFNDFFSYLGDKYSNLLKAHKEIYDELRNGLSHEFLPKNRRFTIYHAGMHIFTKEQIDNNSPLIDLAADNITNDLDGSRVDCGVMFSVQGGEERWLIYVPKLAADFRRTVKKFIRELENDTSLHKNFFEAADQINMEKFN